MDDGDLGISSSKASAAIQIDFIFSGIYSTKSIPIITIAFAVEELATVDISIA